MKTKKFIKVNAEKINKKTKNSHLYRKILKKSFDFQSEISYNNYRNENT